MGRIGDGYGSEFHLRRLLREAPDALGRAPSWDAVGRLANGDEVEWVLLEAKANHVEFCSPPTGARGGSRRQIESALAEVKRLLGVHQSFRWTDTYYQYANRLACLYFLQQKLKLPARLTFAYFCGDKFPDERPCPKDQEQWRALIRACHLTLGLPDEHPLRQRVHDVFLEV